MDTDVNGGLCVGFVHTSLTTAPTHSWTNPEWSTTADLDFAGNSPSSLVRIGTGDRYGNHLSHTPLGASLTS